MTSPTELTTGVRFRSPRETEGNVTVVCDYGKCEHDNRPESVHVRGVYDTRFGPTVSEFFIALPASWDIEEWGAKVIRGL